MTRATVKVTPVVRKQYRLEWEFDLRVVDRWDPDGPAEVRRVRRVRHVNRPSDAYRMAALRLIFVRRDSFATGFDINGHPSGCSLCAGETKRAGLLEDGLGDVPCRYHGGEGFEQLRDRLARWLRWRDSRTVEK
jgi:hypothetical protein